MGPQGSVHQRHPSFRRSGSETATEDGLAAWRRTGTHQGRHTGTAGPGHQNGQERARVSGGSRPQIQRQHSQVDARVPGQASRLHSARTVHKTALGATDVWTGARRWTGSPETFSVQSERQWRRVPAVCGVYNQERSQSSVCSRLFTIFEQHIVNPCQHTATRERSSTVWPSDSLDSSKDRSLCQWVFRYLVCK